MITIFHHLVTHYLIEGIEEINQKSLAGDQSLFNTWATSFYVGRDTNLSGSKRGDLAKLKDLILVLEDKTKKSALLPDDGQTFDRLNKLLTDTLGSVDDKRKSKNKNSGKTEISLTKLSHFLNAAHRKVRNDLKLANLPANHEPLNRLRYYSTKSCIHYLYEELFEGKGQDYGWLNEKEASICKNLELAVIDARPSSDDDPKTIARRIKERAEEIQRESNAINGRYIIKIGGSYMNRDHLFTCMSDVINEMSAIIEDKPVSKISTDINTSISLEMSGEEEIQDESMERERSSDITSSIANLH